MTTLDKIKAEIRSNFEDPTKPNYIDAMMRNIGRDECLAVIEKYAEQEPCTDAQERYEDLCEYFGDAKDVLKSRKDFKAWLDRIKWHIHKAEELAAENDDLRDQLAMKDGFKKKTTLDDLWTNIKKWKEEAEQEPCEECEHNDGECCRILFERSFEQEPTDEWQDGYNMAWEEAEVFYEQEPCDDAISRQNIIDTYESCADMLSDEELEGANLVMEWVYKAPSVNQQEQTGRWIKSKDGYMRCDQCGSRGSAIKARFCHHCGCRMVDPQERSEQG